MTIASAPRRRLAVVGCGAIGTTLAARLVRAGADVTVVSRPSQLAGLGERGLRVTENGVEDTYPVRVQGAVPRDTTLAFVTVKTGDLRDALEELRKAAPDALPVLFQNGLAQDRTARKMGLTSAGVVVNYESESLEPGVARLGRVGGLVIGGERAAEVAQVLATAFPSSVTGNLEGARWMKLLINLTNALPAVTGLARQEILRDLRLARLDVRMMREAAAVARAAHVRFEPLPWASPRLVRALRLAPEPIAARVLRRRALAILGDAPARGSTWQSLARGKRTEIDDLNGEIVRQGGASGVATPVNARVVSLVHRVEETGRFVPVAEVLA